MVGRNYETSRSRTGPGLQTAVYLSFRPAGKVSLQNRNSVFVSGLIMKEPTGYSAFTMFRSGSSKF